MTPRPLTVSVHDLGVIVTVVGGTKRGDALRAVARTIFFPGRTHFAPGGCSFISLADGSLLREGAERVGSLNR